MKAPVYIIYIYLSSNSDSYLWRTYLTGNM